MRVSLEPDDPSYYKGATHIDAYVDGELIEGCLTVDEEKGFVTRFKRDPNTNRIVVIKGIRQRERLNCKKSVMLAGMPYTKPATSMNHWD